MFIYVSFFCLLVLFCYYVLRESFVEQQVSVKTPLMEATPSRWLNPETEWEKFVTEEFREFLLPEGTTFYLGTRGSGRVHIVVRPEHHNPKMLAECLAECLQCPVLVKQTERGLLKGRVIFSPQLGYRNVLRGLTISLERGN